MGDATPSYIPLTKGQIAIVDAEDFSIGLERRWRAKWDKGINGYYAYGNFYDIGTAKLGTGIGSVLAMHRFIMKAKKGEFVDHINKNTLDNRKENLRIVTRSQNGMNKKRPKHNKSGFKGVSWSTRNKCWVAQITINKKLIRIGLFKDLHLAAVAYNKKAVELFGEYASINLL